MIIKEKRWLSRIVAMLCVLTMVVGVLTPASIGVAAATDVKKISIKKISGLDYYDDTEYPMSQDDDTGTYKYKILSDSIELTPSSSSFPNEVIFYISGCSAEPGMNITKGMNVTSDITNAGANKWKVSLFIRRATGEIEVTPSIQYSITYNADANCNITDKDGINILSGKTVAYPSGNVEFKAFVDDNLKAKKKVQVTASNLLGNSTNVIEEENDVYKIENLTENVKVYVTAIDKTFKVQECELFNNNSSAYTYTTYDGTDEVVYDGTFRFYVTPAEGYETPLVYISKNGKLSNEELSDPEKATVIKPVGGNLYSYSKITDNMYIYVVTPSQNTYNVHFNVGTGYTVNGTDEGNNEITDNNATVSHGDNLKFKINATTGYDKPTVIANNNKVISLAGNEQNGYTGTLESVKEDTVVNITGSKLLYEVKFDSKVTTPTSHPEYTYSGETEKIEHGGKYTFYVESETGYSKPIVKYGKDEATAKEVSPVNGTQYVITITEPTTIFITPGELNEYDITYNKAAGYDFYKPDSTSESAINKVKHNETLEFILHVQKHYSNSTPVVSVGGKNQDSSELSEANDGGKNYKYTVKNITSDQIVTVSGIQKNTYKVTLPASNPKYTVTTTDVTNVTAESSFTFHVSINPGYKKGNDFKIKAGGKEFNEPGYCTIESVESDITITIEGIEDETFTAVKDNKHVKEIKGNGDCNLDSLKYGEALEFTVTPSDYYRVTQVAVDGMVVYPVGGVYTVKNITSAPTIRVETVANKLTVKYVDEKYSKNSKTIEYSVEYSEEEYGSVTQESGKVTLYEPENTKLYNFDGWYNEDDRKQTEMQIPMDADNEITLTAKWLLNNNAVKEGITLKTDSHWEQKVSSDGYNFKMLAKTTLEMLEELDEEYKSNVSITGYGTLYSNKTISNCEQYTTRIKGRQRNNTESLVKDSVGNSTTVWSFYANVDYNIEDIQKNVNDYFYLKMDSKQEQERYAIGWLELTVDGEHIIIYAASSEGENGKVKSAVGQ